MPARDLIRLDPRHALASACLLALLIAIALVARDGFVRPFLGDLLAVVWVHVTARAVLDVEAKWTATGALALAVGLELMQWARALEWLGLEDVHIARVVLGATFDPLDLLAYALGWGVAMGAAWATRPSSP